MFCTKCGSELDDSASFCSKCANQVKLIEVKKHIFKSEIKKFKYLKQIIIALVVMSVLFGGWNIYDNYFTEHGKAKQCINKYFKAIQNDDIAKKIQFTTSEVKDYARLTILNSYKCIDIMKKPITSEKNVKRVVATYKVKINGNSEQKLLIELVDRYNDGEYKISSLVIDDGTKLEDFIE